jgi:hypothetical protein
MLTGPILVNVEGWDGFSERLYKNKGWRDLTIGELGRNRGTDELSRNRLFYRSYLVR